MSMGWIKINTGIETHPKVVRIASALHADRKRVVGGLVAVWITFDAHSEDGQLVGYTLQALDESIGWPGFSAAVEAVGWLQTTPEGLTAPRYDEHNGSTGKRRASEAQRKRAKRAESEGKTGGPKAAQSVRKTSASDADKKRTREEKNLIPPTPYAAVPSKWWDSRSGIEAKGQSLGLGRWDERASQLGDGESFQAYERRVMAAAGDGPWCPTRPGAPKPVPLGDALRLVN